MTLLWPLRLTDDMATRSSQKRVVEQPQIPDRLYFKIGDVARLCGVEPYVLRFWETEFPQLKPNKSGTGQRLYRRNDVELALHIKKLVHGEGYTLSGARQVLQAQKGKKGSAAVVAPMPESAPIEEQKPAQTATVLISAKKAVPESVMTALAQIRRELRAILATMAEMPAVSEGTIESDDAPAPISEAQLELEAQSEPEVLPEPEVQPEQQTPAKPRRARVTQMPNPTGSLFDF